MRAVVAERQCSTDVVTEMVKGAAVMRQRMSDHRLDPALQAQQRGGGPPVPAAQVALDADSTLERVPRLPPPNLQFQAALERVRAGADVMPRRQLEQVTPSCGQQAAVKRWAASQRLYAWRTRQA